MRKRTVRILPEKIRGEINLSQFRILKKCRKRIADGK
jgi:hypothetical protein